MRRMVLARRVPDKIRETIEQISGGDYIIALEDLRDCEILKSCGFQPRSQRFVLGLLLVLLASCPSRSQKAVNCFCHRRLVEPSLPRDDDAFLINEHAHIRPRSECRPDGVIHSVHVDRRLYLESILKLMSELQSLW